MSEHTIESLAQRIEKLERELAMLRGVIPPTRDFHSVVGMFRGSDFMKQVDAEIEAMRAAEQKSLDERVIE
jgi:hypothetical protein